MYIYIYIYIYIHTHTQVLYITNIVYSFETHTGKFYSDTFLTTLRIGVSDMCLSVLTNLCLAAPEDKKALEWLEKSTQPLKSAKLALI